MQSEKKILSIRFKMYIFAAVTVLVVALGIAAISFFTSVNRIESLYKQSTSDNARNFASMVDGDYLAELKEVVASDEYQALREKAEAEDNEELIEEYLKEHDLWDGYIKIRIQISDYLANMEGIEYLYVVAHGDIDSLYDMYLIDDVSTPLYETGYYEEREEELRGFDLTDLPEPTISNGDWGWLCSDFKPVYDSHGKCVCIVGCDYSMKEVMTERATFFASILAGAAGFIVLVLIGAMFFINTTVAQPIKAMTEEMKRFNPANAKDYETAGVVDLVITSNDEISEIYKGIKEMQMSIVDYLKEKEKVENDIKNKDQKIDKLNDESFKDALTGAGNKAAFNKKADKMRYRIAKGSEEFAIVMVDINNLKHVNDRCGHEAGDIYLIGCCNMITEVFRRSQVCRIGGDEFVIILKDDDYKERHALVEKLKENFERSYNQTDKDPWFRYSAAVGLAENTAEDTTLDSVLKRADQAMYDDKARFKSRYGEER